MELLDKEAKQKTLNRIIAHFKDELGQEIGMIAAEGVLELLLQEAGARIYNKGIEDAKKVFLENFQDLQVNLDVLKREVQ
jgi:uncharacterized protein (DUF2164 family)